MKLSTIYNNETLNIFCDASSATLKNKKYGCSGAVCVCKDTEVDSKYHLMDVPDNNWSEIDAIRIGISLAIMHKDEFKRINLFSDSKMAISGIKTRFQRWKIHNGIIDEVGSGSTVYQQLFIELAINIATEGFTNLNLYHQAGHATNNRAGVNNAMHVFVASNGNREYIDPNFIRYISKWNNYVDESSREIIYRKRDELSLIHIVEPLEFTPSNLGYLKHTLKSILFDKQRAWG